MLCCFPGHSESNRPTYLIPSCLDYKLFRASFLFISSHPCPRRAAAAVYSNASSWTMHCNISLSLSNSVSHNHFSCSVGNPKKIHSTLSSLCPNQNNSIDLRLPGLQNYERIHFCCLSRPVYSSLLCSPSRQIHRGICPKTLISSGTECRTLILSYFRAGPTKNYHL